MRGIHRLVRVTIRIRSSIVNLRTIRIDADADRDAARNSAKLLSKNNQA